jgi:cysteine-rich repeat protein
MGDKMAISGRSRIGRLGNGCAVVFALLVGAQLAIGTASASCGDGNLEAGEECDDGNLANGDCCSPTCQNDPFEASCSQSLCDIPVAGVCNGSGVCVPNCGGANKPALLLKHTGDDSKDKLIFKWNRGHATTVEEFGTPTSTTPYALCIYAGTSSAIFRAAIPAGANWTSVSKGFLYKDKAGTPDGITKVLLKAGEGGAAKALVKGKGLNLPDLPAGSLTLPFLVRLAGANKCFEWILFEEVTQVIKNESGQFKAKQ